MCETKERVQMKKKKRENKTTIMMKENISP
jgi:hypothetical protein